MNVLTGIRYGAELSSAAQRYNVDPKLLAAVAAQETGGPGQNSGSNIVGDHGHGRGLMQIDDRWHAFASTPAAMNPQSNADYAAGLLSSLLQQYGGNVKAALSAYNSGSPTGAGTPTDWGNGKVLNYADSVLAHYQQIAQLQGHSGTAGFGQSEPIPATASATPSSLLQTIASGVYSGMTSATPGMIANGGGDATANALGTSSSATNSNQSLLAQIAQMLQVSQEQQESATSSAPPSQSWSQLNASSAQVTAQADLLMADLGDPAEGANPSDDG